MIHRSSSARERRSASRHRIPSTLEGLEGRLLLAGGDNPLSNVAGALANIYTGAQQGGLNLADPSVAQFSLIDGRILVEIHARGDAARLVGQLQGLQFTPTTILAGANLIDGYLPVDQIAAAAALPLAQSVIPVYSAGLTDQQGTASNQAEQGLHVDLARRLFGVNGAGVTIGVISDSADAKGNGIADSQASGDLPASPQVQDLTPTATGVDEGRAMMEEIYDLAPGANLRFASAGGTEATYASAVAALVAAGCNVIVDDINGIRTDPFFQDGVGAAAINNAVMLGISFFTTAGNRGVSGYESVFRGINATVAGMTGRFHNFDGGGGSDTTQTITLHKGTTDLIFQFDEPFHNSARSVNLYVLDSAGNLLAGVSQGTDDNVATGIPRQIVTVNNTTGGDETVQIAIEQVAGTGDIGRFQYIGYGGTASDPTIVDHLAESGAFHIAENPGHGAALGAITVAASAAATPTTPESFSAVGPVFRVFDAAGNRLPTVEVRQKPDVTSNDGVSVTVPGVFQPRFSGTSAAAPNAAAIAGLLAQFQPGIAPAAVRAAFLAGVVDIGATGYDNRTGHGLIDAVGILLSELGGVLTLNGDFDSAGENDAFRIARDAADDSLIDISDNGTLLGSVHAQFVKRIVVNGLGGTNSLTVDLTNGNPIPSGELSFDGGSAGAANQLAVIGDLFTTATYRPDGATSDQGSVAFGDGATIRFTRVGGVTGSSLAALTLQTAGSGNVLTVTAPAASRNRIAGGSGSVNFAMLTFFDTPDVTIRTDTLARGGVGDSITIDNPGGAALVASDLANFLVQTGGNDDTLTVNADSYLLPVAGGAFTFNPGTGTYTDGTPASNVRGLISLDRIVASGDADFRLTDAQTTLNGGGSVPDGTAAATTLSIAAPGSGNAGNRGSIRVVGGLEAARLTGGDGTAVMDARSFLGNVDMQAGSGTVSLYGGLGNNVLRGGGGSDTFYGGDSRYSLAGTGLLNSGRTTTAVDPASVPQDFYPGADGATNTLLGGSGSSTFFVGTAGATIVGGLGGNVYHLINPPGGLLVAPFGVDITGGGAGTNILDLAGGTAPPIDEYYFLGATPGSGQIVQALAGTATLPAILQVITYRGLGSIVDATIASRLQVQAAGATDLLALAAGSVLGSGPLQFTVNAAASIPITVAHKGSIAAIGSQGETLATTEAAPIFLLAIPSAPAATAAPAAPVATVSAPPVAIVSAPPIPSAVPGFAGLTLGRSVVAGPASARHPRASRPAAAAAHRQALLHKAAAHKVAAHHAAPKATVSHASARGGHARPHAR